MDGSFGPLKSFSIKALNQFVDDDVALKIKKKISKSNYDFKQTFTLVTCWYWQPNKQRSLCSQIF